MNNVWLLVMALIYTAGLIAACVVARMAVFHHVI